MDWLLKTEPTDYSYEDLAREKTTVWSGVTNAAARKNLRAMGVGDRLVVYHTGEERRAVGLARVTKGPRAADDDPKGVVVTIRAAGRLRVPFPLAAIKSEPLFAGSPLLTIGRLSVVPLTGEQYRFLAGGE